MEQLENLLKNNIIYKIIISKKIYKQNEIDKILIEQKKNYYQITKYIKDKVYHENIDFNDLSTIIEYIKKFKNTEIFTDDGNYIFLLNKKGNSTLKKTKSDIINKEDLNLEHNKEKKYIIEDNKKVDFLIHLGIMGKDGLVKPKWQKKFKQINKYLEHIQTIEDQIPENGKILEVGCGKSYLTFALYYYFNVIKNKNVQIYGVDLKSDVIEYCSSLSKKLNYTNLKFYNCDIKDFVHNHKNIDMVISLHACNTATDFSIYNGIVLNAKVILSLPCCHNEVYTQIENEMLKDFLKHGILKERFSAELTDSLRGLLLESCSYKTEIIEFIDFENTPKNILIKSVYNEKINREKAYNSYKNLSHEFNVNITLENLLKENLEEMEGIY